jgi:hypothetical protein
VVTWPPEAGAPCVLDRVVTGAPDGADPLLVDPEPE